MTAIEKFLINAPARGLLIYQTGPDTTGFYYYNGNQWTLLISNSNSDSLLWRLDGNTGFSGGATIFGNQGQSQFEF
jgi:hypothetical protein